MGTEIKFCEHKKERMISKIESFHSSQTTVRNHKPITFIEAKYTVEVMSGGSQIYLVLLAKCTQYRTQHVLVEIHIKEPITHPPCVWD